MNVLLTILIIVGALGGPALAIFSVYRRITNPDKNTAGYVYNGKDWVAWLLMFCILADIFIGFIMPIFDEGYHPEWGALGLMLVAIVLYICYAVIAVVPATAEEVAKQKAEGKTVLGSLGATSSSMFKGIMTAVGAILVSLPGMIGEAFNPTLAVKTVGNTVYKVIGTGFNYAVGGVMGLVLVAVVLFVIAYLVSLILAIIGTFAIGVLAVIKFVKNNMELFRK